MIIIDHQSIVGLRRRRGAFRRRICRRPDSTSTRMAAWTSSGSRTTTPRFIRSRTRPRSSGGMAGRLDLLFQVIIGVYKKKLFYNYFERPEACGGAILCYSGASVAAPMLASMTLHWPRLRGDFRLFSSSIAVSVVHPLPMPPPSFAPPGGGTALLSTLEGILAPARTMGRGVPTVEGVCNQPHRADGNAPPNTG